MAELKKLNLTQPNLSNPISPTASSTSPVTPSLPAPIKQKGPLIVVLVILAGVASGYALSQFFPKTTSTSTLSPASQADISNVKTGDTFGVESDAFSDTADGILEKGGINGEGSHKLIRPGGESQTVYLTSSVVDLDELVGHKVTVWGETFDAQKAGWLMDVGRVKVLELNASTE